MLSSYNRARLLLSLGALVCFMLFWWAGVAFGIPRFTGHSASLVTQPSAAAAFLVTAVVLLAAVLIGSLVAGTIRFDAGLFVATIGLAALSVRGGPVRQVLFASQQQDVFLAMTGEVIVLYMIIGLAWSLLWLLHFRGLLRHDRFRDGLEDTHSPLHLRLLALGTQVFVTALILALLAQSQEKKQVLAAVAIASCVGAIAAHYAFPVRPSVWFWTGPLLVALIGYLLESQEPGTGWQIGRVSQPLARPLPLDYASVGCAAAIYGYWSSRRWQRDRNAQAELDG